MRVAAAIIALTIAVCALAEEPQPPQKEEGGVVIVTPGKDFEKVADEAGQIYLTRGYKGVVPGVRDESAVPSKAGGGGGETPVVKWVGFQPFATYSRVFVQVDGRYVFTVAKPKPTEIEVRIPDASVSSTNDLRHLVTRAFPTAVDQIFVEAPKEGLNAVVVRIVLKKPVAYLYRSEGKYIFVDVEL